MEMIVLFFFRIILGCVQQEAVYPSLMLGIQYSLGLAGHAQVPGAKEQRQWAGRVQQEAV